MKVFNLEQGLKLHSAISWFKQNSFVLKVFQLEQGLKFSNRKSQLQINAIGFIFYYLFLLLYINVLIDINIKSAAPKKWDFCPNMSPNLFPTMKPNPDIIAVIIPI